MTGSDAYKRDLTFLQLPYRGDRFTPTGNLRVALKDHFIYSQNIFQTQITWNSWTVLSLLPCHFKPPFCPCPMALSDLPKNIFRPISFRALDPFIPSSPSPPRYPRSRALLRYPKSIFRYPQRLFRPPISFQVFQGPLIAMKSFWFLSGPLNPPKVLFPQSEYFAQNILDRSRRDILLGAGAVKNDADKAPREV